MDIITEDTFIVQKHRELVTYKNPVSSAAHEGVHNRQAHGRFTPYQNTEQTRHNPRMHVATPEECRA
jgi:hypothetical protein